MTNNSRVLNISRGFTLKYKQALRAIENCAAAWVDPGQSIRDVSLAESIAMRNKQAANREPLPNIELPGLIYEPSPANLASSRRGYSLVRQAHEFAAAQ